MARFGFMLSIRLNIERMPNQAQVRLNSIGIHLICNASVTVAQVGDATSAGWVTFRDLTPHSPLGDPPQKTPRRAVRSPMSQPRDKQTSHRPGARKPDQPL